MGRTRSTFLPVVSRYLLREFIGLFLLIVGAFLILYLIIDFFDRLDFLLRNQASASSAIAYFLFKVPLIITQILPASVMAAVLLSLGVLSRHNEITALRASGVSLAQTAVPILALAALISVAALVWDETVVPYCTRHSQYVNIVEIRKRAQRGILSEREVWYHGSGGFYNIDHIDPQRSTLFGLTIYRTDSAFNLNSVIEVTAGHWTGDSWQLSGALERSVERNGEITTQAIAPEQVVIEETLGDFLEVRREPGELSYLALRDHMRDLTRKG